MKHARIVHSDPEILGGTPVFVGTRVPLRNLIDYLEGGYSLDEFWLHDKNLDGNRLNKILRTRNIRGVIVVGLMKENRLPDRFLPCNET